MEISTQRPPSRFCTRSGFVYSVHQQPASCERPEVHICWQHVSLLRASTSGALNSLICADVPLRNYSLAHFRELECSLSADLAQMAHYCRQWRLKQSPTETVCSVFYLHNTRANHELSVLLCGQRIRHDSHPVYLGITLDRTLSVLQGTPLEDCYQVEEP